MLARHRSLLVQLRDKVFSKKVPALFVSRMWKPLFDGLGMMKEDMKMMLM